MLKLCNNDFSVMIYIRKVLCSDETWTAYTAMMKVDVNNKHVPCKKTRMTIKGRSNVRPMMASLGLRFGSDDSDIRIISIP